jgi:hypothetical protein
MNPDIQLPGHSVHKKQVRQFVSYTFFLYIEVGITKITSIY